MSIHGPHLWSWEQSLSLRYVVTDVGCYVSSVWMPSVGIHALHKYLHILYCLVLPSVCPRWFSCCCDKNTWKKHLKGENICSGLQFEGIPSIMAEKAWCQVQEASWQHCTHRQEEGSIHFLPHTKLICHLWTKLDFFFLLRELVVRAVPCKLRVRWRRKGGEMT